MKSIVVYYSRKGSNKFLAEKIARQFSCDLEQIRPKSNAFSLILTNINTGIKKLSSDISAYDRVIMVGPIFMGRFIPPLKSFVMKYKDQINQLVFVTCCGSTYDKKEEKFGHGLVFKEVKKILGDKLVLTRAFPVGLVLPEEKREDPDAFMKTHLNDDNFSGEIQERFEKLLQEMA